MPIGPFGHPCFCPINNGMSNYGWVGSWASICAYNWRDFISIIAGLLNIFFWAVLSIPQYRKIIRMRSAAGLSISMLLFWTIADILGLIGLILSGETGTLVWLTAFFTFNNSLGVCIWVFYAKIYPRFFLKKNENSHDGYTSLDDDGNAERKGLLDNNDDSSDDDDDDDKHGTVFVLGGKGRKQQNFQNNHSSDGGFGTEKKNTKKNSFEKNSQNAKIDDNLDTKSLLTDDDLLDIPITNIGIDNSINTVADSGANNGGNGRFAPALMNSSNSHSLSLSNPLNHTSFALIICLIAVIYIPSTDATRLRHAARHVQDLATETITQVYQAIIGEDLPPCVPVHLPPAIPRIIGFVLTVICALMNSWSRVPQILLNKKRKLTAGLSLTFILFQLCANISFFFSRFMPTTLKFNMHWLETSFPWVISTAFSTLSLLVIWWQVYFYGNGSSILPRSKFKYSRTIFDQIFFLLPLRQDGQSDDGFDGYYNAIENFKENPEEFFRVASQIQSRRMYNTIDSLDTIDSTGSGDDNSSTSINSLGQSGKKYNKDDDLGDIDANYPSNDDDEGDDIFPEDFVTDADIKIIKESNFHNPMFGITTDMEADSLMYTAIVQSSSFLRTGSFSNTPSSMALQRSTSKLERSSSRFGGAGGLGGGLMSGRSFIRTKSKFNITPAKGYQDSTEMQLP